jgi:hypothetical protein
MKESIASLDREFTLIHRGWRELLDRIPPQLLYQKIRASASGPDKSFGEEVLRSAGAIEQTFGGLTANLWDDPFEWTLPETLTTREKLREYLDEVEATRKRGFELLRSDDDLAKEIMAPAGPTQLLPLLLDTLERAGHHLGSAEAILKVLTKQKSDH